MAFDQFRKPLTTSICVCGNTDPGRQHLWFYRPAKNAGAQSEKFREWGWDLGFPL